MILAVIESFVLNFVLLLVCVINIQNGPVGGVHYYEQPVQERFGKSVQNRCPGYFFDTLQKVFESTGGQFLIVPGNYRAYSRTFVIQERFQQPLRCIIFGLLVWNNQQSFPYRR